MNDEAPTDAIALRTENLRHQMERSCELFQEFMRTYINPGRMQTSAIVLNALRLDCARMSEQFAIVSESAGRMAEVLMDEE